MTTVLDLFKLDGQSALVTGGAKGLGTKINEGLLEAGVENLFFCGRGKHGSLHKEEERLRGLFPQAGIQGIECDITDENQVGKLTNRIRELGFMISILVNSAGATWAAPSVDQTLKTWHRALDVNLTGAFLVTRDIARTFMIPARKGSVINISSILALVGNAELAQVGYSASKSALCGLTRQLAIEFADRGIRVNAILPSFVEGDSMAKAFTHPESPVRKTLLEMIPLKRFARADDLKAIVCFLASEASGYISGQNLVLDGGYTLR
ncbi:MAG: SDR family oxidoreductase [Candidatus Thorarchaeota archaeon]